MKRISVQNHIILLTIILCIAMPCCSKKDNQNDNEFAEMLANRPAPDLKRLAERSAPSYTSKDATESFYDILKLRDIGGTNAVPVLETIIAENFYSTRIHGYAAAQALFCIGTPEAHKALSKYLLSDQYYADLGFNYTSHWQMNESERNNFIEKYHLQNISEDLAVKLDVNTHKDKKEPRLDFIVTLSNTSNKSYWIRDRQIYLGEMLYFQSKSGRFAPKFVTADYNAKIPKWIELAPVISHQYKISVHVRRNGEKKFPFYSKYKDITLQLETFDMAYDILHAGRFKVYAMFEERPLNKVQMENLKIDNPWSGRAVSEPIIVNIPGK